MVKSKKIIAGAIALTLVIAGFAPKVVRAEDKDATSDTATLPDLLGSETNINVRTFSDGSNYVYSVRINYGSMNFTYDYGSHWDPKTHSYGNDGQTTVGWQAGDWDGDKNNKIEVINNSNYPVEVTMKSLIEPGKLNATSGEGSVIGVFTDTNNDLGSIVPMNGVSSSGKNRVNAKYTEWTLVLDVDDQKAVLKSVGETRTDANNDGYADSFGFFAVLASGTKSTENKLNRIISGEVFFGLSGVPDAGLKLGSENSYDAVGKIMLTIKPVLSGVTEVNPLNQ